MPKAVANNGIPKEATLNEVSLNLAVLMRKKGKRREVAGRINKKQNRADQQISKNRTENSHYPPLTNIMINNTFLTKSTEENKSIS